MSPDEEATRHARILAAARWCFLHFGFKKTTFDDIATRAGLSRTLLYRSFSSKDEIYSAVFSDWLIARRPAVEQTVRQPGSARDRLVEVCRLVLIEPWAEMVCTPMGGEFLEACARIAPDAEARYREIVVTGVTAILNDQAAAEVFLLALDGLLADQPPEEELRRRVAILAERFAPDTQLQEART